MGRKVSVRGLGKSPGQVPTSGVSSGPSGVTSPGGSGIFTPGGWQAASPKRFPERVNNGDALDAEYTNSMGEYILRLEERIESLEDKNQALLERIELLEDES